MLYPYYNSLNMSIRAFHVLLHENKKIKIKNQNQK